MKPLKSIITLEQIEDLASRSYLRYGKSILADGDVKITEQNTFNVEAHVQHGQGERRIVKLESTPKGFKFKCSCSNKKDLFCEHCTAVALSLLEK